MNDLFEVITAGQIANIVCIDRHIGVSTHQHRQQLTHLIKIVLRLPLLSRSEPE
jgi:hypothetical protein